MYATYELFNSSSFSHYHPSFLSSQHPPTTPVNNAMQVDFVSFQHRRSGPALSAKSPKPIGTNHESNK